MSKSHSNAFEQITVIFVGLSKAFCKKLKYTGKEGEYISLFLFGGQNCKNQNQSIK